MLTIQPYTLLNFQVFVGTGAQTGGHTLTLNLPLSKENVFWLTITNTYQSDILENFFKIYVFHILNDLLSRPTLKRTLDRFSAVLVTSLYWVQKM